MKAKYLFLLVCIAAIGMQAGAQAAQDMRIVQVQGSAIAYVEPDMATLRFAVELQADSAQKAQTALSSKASAIVTAFQNAGIDKKLIKTDRYRISPVYSTKQDKQNTIIGYRAETTLEAVIEKLELIPSLIDTALSAGANRLQSLDFSKKDMSSAVLALIGEACLDAKRKAESAAQVLGVRVGLPHSVSVRDSIPQGRAYEGVMMMKAAVPEASVAPGQLEIEVNVSVAFELLPLN